MKIVLDSNVLFSAIIKDSSTRKTILDYEGKFLFPSYVFVEFERHKEELYTKSGMSASECASLMQILLSKVLIIPQEALLPYREEALEIMKDIDINDVLFIACALAFPPSVIWSDDKALKRQKKIRVLNTLEIIKLV